MFKRVAFTTLLAAGLFALPAAKITDDPLPCPGCDWRSATAFSETVADLRTDDPLPCPGCDWRGEVETTQKVSDMRTDDPLPCPGCDWVKNVEALELANRA